MVKKLENELVYEIGQVKLDPETYIISVGDTHFRLEHNEYGNPFLVEVDPKKFKEMSDFIADTIRTSLDNESILKYCVYIMQYKPMMELVAKLRKNKKPIIKAENGYLELFVDGVSYPITD